MVFKQIREDAGLSIEQDTSSVPNDGKYYVLHEGKVVGSYRSLKKAREKYRETLDGLELPTPVGPTPEEIRAAALKSMSDSIVDRMEMETFANAKGKNVRRGRSRTFG